jgi:oligopeptide/dipeptide ABC transporter ATP-binding protein
MDGLLAVKNLSVDFKIKSGRFTRPDILSAVADVSLRLERGKTLAIVGESGCGKTTIANAILGFVPITAGEITVDGIRLDKNTKPSERKRARGILQSVYQDPFGSLNPRFNVRAIVAEPLVLRGERRKDVLDETVVTLLKQVGMGEDDLHRNIFEFSGGQRQRIAVARALSVKPKLIVCDEPTSALDVSVHAQICNLLIDLQQKTGVAYLFISHNLALVRHISSDVAVMYSGQIVESGATGEVFENPMHPYTKALLSAAYGIRDGAKKRIVLPGEVASPINAPATCRFLGRCAYARDSCGKIKPESKRVSDKHFYACCNDQAENR